MRFTAFSRCAAIMLAFAVVTATPARAEDDDDECNGIVEALKKYGERLMKSDQKATPKAV
jgi:hypothetical protein